MVDNDSKVSLLGLKAVPAALGNLLTDADMQDAPDLQATYATIPFASSNCSYKRQDFWRL